MSLRLLERLFQHRSPAVRSAAVEAALRTELGIQDLILAPSLNLFDVLLCKWIYSSICIVVYVICIYLKSSMKLVGPFCVSRMYVGSRPVEPVSSRRSCTRPRFLTPSLGSEDVPGSVAIKTVVYWAWPSTLCSRLGLCRRCTSRLLGSRSCVVLEILRMSKL